MNFKILFTSPEYQMLDGSTVTENSVRIAVAMQSGKTLDELTLTDYDACKKQWIKLLVALSHNPNYIARKTQLLAMLRELNHIINGRPAWDAGLDDEEDETPKRRASKERQLIGFRPSQRYYDYVRSFGNRLFLGVITDDLDAEEKMLLARKWRKLTEDTAVAQWLLKYVGLMSEANDARMMTLATKFIGCHKHLLQAPVSELVTWMKNDVANSYATSSIATILRKPLPEHISIVLNSL